MRLLGCNPSDPTRYDEGHPLLVEPGALRLDPVAPPLADLVPGAQLCYRSYFFGAVRRRRNARLCSCAARSCRFSSSTEIPLLAFCFVARWAVTNAFAFFSHSGWTGLRRAGPCSRLTQTLPSICPPHIAQTAGPRRCAAAVVFRAGRAAWKTTVPSSRDTVTGDAGEIE